ncbi:MAG: hypothetical protein ABI867_13175 [Kofleriaceae bacterium]
MTVDGLIRTVLYEGYSLYPYRPSALKNQKRFAFGSIYPRAWAERTGEPFTLRAECVVDGGHAVTIAIRYLLLRRGGGAEEKTIELGEHALVAGSTGAVAICDAGDGLWRIAVELENTAAIDPAADREAAMDVTMASTHVIVRSLGGLAVSAIDPPARAVAAIACCRTLGLYPVVVARDTVLMSPIVLADFPELSEHSPGDFFDGTEIDEMLTLRVLTLTDAEKREACASDPRVAALIARTEALGIEATARLHGATRIGPQPGTRVRLRPNRRADAFDVILAGKLATVSKLERDLEGRVYCAVTIDDDPGADLGESGMPGHRFFFAPDELEVIA